jgi:hypothetical protein
MIKSPLVLAALLALGACQKGPDSDAERGAPPPPPSASSEPGACKAGGGKPGDGVSAQYFPRQVRDLCVDPNGETRAYGVAASEGIDKVCLEQFDGECEVYKSYGLERLVTLRYVDGTGSPGTVTVTLSRFATPEGAYGFFTHRIIGGADPATRAPDPLAAGAAGALGSGTATVVRGAHVVELVYTNEREPIERVAALARSILPVIAAEIGRRLPGEPVLPDAARALPEAGRVRLGIAYETRDLLGVSGTGGGAVGFYQQGAKRWRVLCVDRPDEPGAEDVVRTFVKALGAKAEKGTVYRALRFTVVASGSGRKLEWVMARAGSRVFAVGDEEYAVGGEKSAEEVSQVTLTLPEKLETLRRLVQGEVPAPGK